MTEFGAFCVAAMFVLGLWKWWELLIYFWKKLWR